MRITTGIIFVVTIMLTACFGGGSSIPDDHYYRLPELTGKKLTKPILTGTLSVKRVITHGIYGERALIYTDKNSTIKLNRYHYHHWEKSPSKLIQDNLVQYLKTVGVAHQVISQSHNTNENYLLETELITMHREVTQQGYSASISMDIRLYNKSNNSIYINKRYHSKISTTSNKIVDTIESYGKGLHHIYDELISDLSHLHIENLSN